MRQIDRAILVGFLAIVGFAVTRADSAFRPRVGCAPADDKDRTAWLYKTSGQDGWFKKDAGDDWIETTADGGEARFVEVARTAEYVELFDKTRPMTMRLYTDHVAFRRGDQGGWKRFHSGRWVAVGELPAAPKPPPQDKAAGTATKWEYKVVVASDDPGDVEKGLNQLGAAGWELSSTVTRIAGEMVKGPDGLPHVVNNSTVQLILKRPKR